MDINYEELFGVPTEEQEPDTDAADEMADAVEEQEDGDPAEVPEEGQDTTEPDDPAQGAPEGAERKQTREDNARFAAARRKAEQQRDEAIERERQRSQQEMDAMIAGMGLVNPYTNAPITNKAEYDAYKASHDEQQRKAVAKKAGMSDEEFGRFMAEQPEVRDAKAAKARADEAQAQQRIQAEIAEIAKIDPGIKSLSDLAGMDNYPQFYAMVERGMTLSEAYKVLNFDHIRKGERDQAAAAQRQAAINAAGKSHLTGSKSRGAGATPVPADVKAQYRVFMPDASDAEIAAHYNRSRKGG